MTELALPVLYALFLWWIGTGVILWLDGLPRETYRWSMLGATGLLVLGLNGVASSAGDVTVGGVYCAFSSALAVWAWQEMAFLMGFLTGPRRAPCPPGIGGWRRAYYATQAILWHELAILAGGVAVIALAWDGPNQFGVWTYLVLWIMRISAKLNVFLGVRNLYLDWLPEHLGHLRGYFRCRPMNLLFPPAVTGAAVATVLVATEALSPAAAPFEVAGFTFLATLLALAVLEHLFLVLPLSLEALFSWGLRSRSALVRRRPSPCPVVE